MIYNISKQKTVFVKCVVTASETTWLLSPPMQERITMMLFVNITPMHHLMDFAGEEFLKIFFLLYSCTIPSKKQCLKHGS